MAQSGLGSLYGGLLKAADEFSRLLQSRTDPVLFVLVMQPEHPFQPITVRVGIGKPRRFRECLCASNSSWHIAEIIGILPPSILPNLFCVNKSTRAQAGRICPIVTLSLGQSIADRSSGGISFFGDIHQAQLFSEPVPRKQLFVKNFRGASDRIAFYPYISRKSCTSGTSARASLVRLPLRRG